jgi:hypothetical protein
MAGYDAGPLRLMIARVISRTTFERCCETKPQRHWVEHKTFPSHLTSARQEICAHWKNRLTMGIVCSPIACTYSVRKNELNGSRLRTAPHRGLSS